MMKKYCPNCKIEVEAGRFCPECGTKMDDIHSELFCPECGKVYDHGKFCPACGVKLEERKKIGEAPTVIVSPSSSHSSIECPACGYENPAGSTVCAGCGFPLESANDENTISSNTATLSEDEAILAKYTDEYGDLRTLNEEEAPLAVEEIKRIAEKGNSKAEYFLTGLYFAGKHIGQDYQKAFDLLNDAESKGESLAGMAKALFYLNGIIVDQDLAEAERRLDTALHIPEVMCMKGLVCSELGRMDEAVKWFRKSAEGNDQEGLLYIGYSYLNGDGDCPVDTVQAFECFSKSAALGNVEAENMLGVCYLNGQGTEPDEEQALYWFQEAVKHNDPNAQSNLAHAYKEGLLGLKADPEKAFELYKKAAEQDNVDAMFEVAEYYNASYLTAQKSVEWYQKAADAGHGEAMFELAQKYENGSNVEKDSAKAKEYYKKAAEVGCERAIKREEESHSYMNWLDETGQRFRADTPDDAYASFMEDLQKDASNGLDLAQKLLGNCYFDGKGVKQDNKEAVKWTRMAAGQGNVLAQYNMGYSYYNGLGVPHDYREAVNWYKKSAEQGYAHAQFLLGLCYDNGQGVPHDYGEAVKWYKKAAEQGFARAQCNLGYCYEAGQGVPQDYREAVKWYKKAAEQGDMYAQKNLGKCYYNGQGVQQNYGEAVKWYKKAAEQGNMYAQNNLGVCYHNGQGVPQDYGEAVRLYKLSADQGNATAQNNLGICYENGQGVQKDYGEAVKWYKKAAEQGHTDAQKNLADCEEKAKRSAAAKKAAATRRENQQKMTVKFDKIWYDDYNGFFRIHTNLTLDHALNEDGRIVVWFYNSKGIALKAGTDNFDEFFKTSDGQVVVQAPIMPDYKSCIRNDVMAALQYSHFHLAGEYVHELKFRVGVFFGNTHLAYSDYVDFKVEVKRGLFGGIKYRIIK